MKYIMKKNKMMLLAAACSILLLGSCGTSKNVQGSGSTSASHQKENATKGSDSRQSETLKKLAFVQKVSDNQVYTKNIVGNMSFTLQAGDKDITVPGKLSMRKDEIIRIHKLKVFAVGFLHAKVAGGGNSAVVFVDHHNAAVNTGIALADGIADILAAIVEQNDLQIPVGLAADALNTAGNMVCCVVNRNNNAD